MEWKKKTFEITLKIDNEDIVFECAAVSALARADFQAQVIEDASVSADGQQNIKLNAEVIAKKDFYLLAYTVQKINTEEKYSTMNLKQRIAFWEKFADYYQNEFVKLTEEIKQRGGDLS